jgi:hypothetical protein
MFKAMLSPPAKAMGGLDHALAVHGHFSRRAQLAHLAPTLVRHALAQGRGQGDSGDALNSPCLPSVRRVRHSIIPLFKLPFLPLRLPIGQRTGIDKAMDHASLVDELRAFVAERDWSQFHDPKNLAMLLASEAGELGGRVPLGAERQGRRLLARARGAPAHRQRNWRRGHRARAAV